MNNHLSVQEDSTSKSRSRLRTVLPWQDQRMFYRRYPLVKDKAATTHIEVPIEEPTDFNDLPEYMTEEEFEAFLIKNGVFDKLLSQLAQTPRSQNWEAELDEL